MTPSSSSVSCGVSTAVGSSRISRSTWRESALRISTRCWVPTGRSSISAVGVHGQAVLLRERAHHRAGAVEMSSTPPPRVGSWPSIMFSATVMTGTSWKCWCTMPMPRRMASRGSLIGVVSPLTLTVPESGVMRPKIWLTRVDLPAPFSPSSATISPRRTWMLMSRLARTEPKLFDSPAMSRSTSPTFPSPNPDCSGGSSRTASVVAIASRCSGAVSAGTGVGSYSSSVITGLP